MISDTQVRAWQDDSTATACYYHPLLAPRYYDCVTTTASSSNHYHPLLPPHELTSQPHSQQHFPDVLLCDAERIGGGGGGSGEIDPSSLALDDNEVLVGFRNFTSQN